MICVNVNGPFDNHRQWKHPLPLKSRQTELGSANLLQPKILWTMPTDNDPWCRQVHVLKWARPGFHTLDPTSVSAGKTDIGPTAIRAALSPYFSQHKAVVRGLIKLHSLFQWQAARCSDEETDANLNPCIAVVPPSDTTHIHIMEILKDIRDGIDPMLDGCPSKEVYEDARVCYDQLLKSRNIDQPLFEDWQSSTSALTASSHSHSKWMPKGQERVSKHGLDGHPRSQP